MVYENVECMRQILADHQRKLDTMANGMDTIQVQLQIRILFELHFCLQMYRSYE